MKEIKFRVFIPQEVIDNTSWMNIAPFMMPVEELEWTVTETGRYLTHIITDVAEFKADEVYLMQYTGLKDKNGVEIYEGDIIRGKRSGLECLGVVIYRGCSFELKWIKSPFEGMDEPSKQTFRVISLDMRMVDYWREREIIGNQFENPELMEDFK